MKKWEYKSVIGFESSNRLTGILNEAGKSGWELISVINIGTRQEAIFKRELIESKMITD